MLNYRQPTKLREGSVFTRVCVCVCVCPEGWVPCDHYLGNIGPHCTGPTPPPDIGPHCTGTPTPPCGHGTSLYRNPHTLLVTSGGNQWRSVQTVHFRTPPVDIYLVAIEVCLVGASGQYASYWNAFLSTTTFNIQ